MIFLIKGNTMKKILLSVLLVSLCTSSFAGGNHGGNNVHNTYNNYQGGYHGNNYRGGCCGWVGPVIIGGAVGLGIGAVVSTPTYVQPPVVIYNEPVYNNTVQTNNSCQYPFVATYNRIYTTDRFGNNIQVDQFIGCR